MKIRIGKKVYDADDVPIMVIFKNDKERRAVGKNISTMKPRRGKRLYVTYDSRKFSDKKIEAWMKSEILRLT